MKMRKILSFVLVLSLVLGSFSMAFAATPATSAGLTDIAGVAAEEAIQVNYDLGIITGNPDGTFLPTKAVNRAEFAAMITRALAVPESALAGYTATTFKDTTGYGWAVPYLAFCQSKGILIGDGMGNVMPGRTINVNEAMTMVLRAIGYTENSSMLVGTWPSKYVTVAQNIGLYEDVAAAINVDKANAAQIIYNTLPARKVAVNSDGKTDYLSDIIVDGVAMKASMLTTGLNCTYNDQLIAYSDTSLINITPYVGAQATVYKNKDKEIVAVSQISTFITGKFKSGDFTTFKSGGTDYNFRPATTTTVAAVKNAKVVTGSTVGAFATNVTVTLAAKISGKTITDVYSIGTWDVTSHTKVADSDLTQISKNSKLLGKSFAKNNNNDIDVTSFELVGVKSLADIKADNVVYVYTLNNGPSDKIVKVAVGTAVIEGMVQSYNATDDEFVINGKTYANSGTTNNSDDNIKATNVANDVKVWLDGYGDSYKFDVTKGQANNYAVVTGGNTLSGYDNLVKLFTADGSNKSYKFDMDNVTATSAALGQIVGYSLDKDGMIDGFANVSGAATKTSISLNSAQGLVLNNTKSLKYGVASNSAIISNDVVVYTYAKGGASFTGLGDVKVSSIDKIKTGVNIVATSDASIYLDKDGKVVAMLVPAANASKSDTDLYAVINSVSATANADKDKVFQLIGFANGANLDKLTDGKNVATDFGTYIQLYKMGTDANGVITAIKQVNVSYDSTVASNVFTSISGVTVADAGTGYIKTTNASITVGDTTFAGGEVIAIAKDAKYYEVTFDGANIDEYTTFSGTPAKGDMVWVFNTDNDTDGYDVVIVLAK